MSCSASAFAAPCFTFTLALCLAVACTEDGDEPPPGGTEAGTHYVIPFTTSVNGEPLACGRTYEGLGRSMSTIEARDVRFYVHDVMLVTADGTKVPLLLDDDKQFQLRYPKSDGSQGGLALLDFTDDASSLCADEGTPQTRDFVSGRAAEGEYTAVEFVVGVPEEVNHVDAAMAAPPLNAAGLQWTWTLGYRHMKIDMQATTGEKVKEAYTFHPGSQGCENSGTDASGPSACSVPLLATIALDLQIGSQAVELDLARFYAEDDLDRGRGCMFVRNLEDALDGEDVVPNGCEEMFAAIGIVLPEFAMDGTVMGQPTAVEQTAFRAIAFEADSTQPAPGGMTP